MFVCSFVVCLFVCLFGAVTIRYSRWISLAYDELMLSFVHQKLTAKEERLWDAFCKLDLNGDGRVTVDELAQVSASQHIFDSKTDIKKVLLLSFRC